MESKIVMVHITTGATLSYSHGFAILAAILIKQGYKHDDIKLVTVKTNNFKSAADKILRLNPFIVLVTCTSNQWDNAKKLASYIKQIDNSLPICVGGGHITALPESIYNSSFDIGVVGEAESVISTIVNEALISNMNSNKILYKPEKTISMLDSLPLPYIQLFDKVDILEYPSVMFSRGCPFKCSYCMSRKGGYSGKVRWKSPERAITEVIELINYAQPKDIFIDDDTILKKPNWVIKFCELYKNKINIPFCCNARPETITRELVQCLREANCQAIGIGIESGSPRIRKDILLRTMTDDTIIQAFNIVKSFGLRTWSFNMVGMPTETPEDFMATINLNELVQTDYVRISIFTPYPGTPIYNINKESLFDHGYFRPLTGLSLEFQEMYKKWIRQLSSEGRLWYTEAESGLISR